MNYLLINVIKTCSIAPCANLYTYFFTFANFQCCNCPNVEQIIQPPGHTGAQILFYFQDTSEEDFQIAFTKKILKLEDPKNGQIPKNKTNELVKVNEAYQYLLRQKAAWENKLKLRMGKSYLFD